jgi:hypothetical protein
MKLGVPIGILSAGILASSTAGATGERLSHAYVIAVGYNGLPVASSAPLEPLHFADDDAIAFAAFASEGAQQTHLLTVIDSETQRRLGRWVPEVKPPSTTELHAAVNDIRRAIEGDAQGGVESTVYFYYSGHGIDESGRPPALALLDADLTRERLYADVLAALPATHVHLFVDACHAEAVVRPRDAQALIVPTTEQDAAQYASTSTLARFPSVGAIIAATRGAQTHEWERYSGGVFTHELLSGLRGAADVDGNGRVEYSEIAAFLSAANGAVADPRAHLAPVVRPPIDDPRVAIFDLRTRTEDVVLEGRVEGHGLLSVEDEQGDRILDFRAEAGYRARFLVPATRTLYVRSDGGETVLRAPPGARIALGSLVFAEAPVAARGALESALRRGLFATSFGRSYYRGFVDQASNLVPVPLLDADSGDALNDAPEAPPKAAATRTFGWIALGTAGACAVGASVFGAVALDARSTFQNTSFERAAANAADRYAMDSAAFAALGGCAVVSAAIGTYFLLHSPRGPTMPAANSLRFDPQRMTFDF